MGVTAQPRTLSWWLCGVDKRQPFSSERLLESFFSTLLFVVIKLLGNLCFRGTYFSVKYVCLLYVEDLSNGINDIFHGKSYRTKGIGDKLR